MMVKLDNTVLYNTVSSKALCSLFEGYKVLLDQLAENSRCKIMTGYPRLEEILAGDCLKIDLHILATRNIKVALNSFQHLYFDGSL